MNTKLIVLIAIVSALALTMLLQAYYRWYYSLRHRVNVILRNARRQARQEAHRNSRHVFTAGPDPLSVPHGQLDPFVVASLPVLDYVLGSMMLECAVCISEFEVGEKVRVLPKCKHCFHVDCIDMWFSCHTTCPLCRSQVTLRKLSMRRIVGVGQRPTAVAPLAELDLECGVDELT